MISMMQSGHTKGIEGIITGVEGNKVTIHPKIHAHIMLTQVNMRLY